MASKRIHQTKIEAFFTKKTTSTIPTPADTKNSLPEDQNKESLGLSLVERKDLNAGQQEDTDLSKIVQSDDSEQDSDIEMASSSNETASPGSTSQGQSPSLSASGAVPTIATVPPPTAVFDTFTLLPITAEHMPAFQRLLKTLLPVAYPTRFFNDILATNSHLGRVAVWHADEAAAAIGCIKARLEDVDPADTTGTTAVSSSSSSSVIIEQQLYIQTLGVLAPYRGHGVAARLLEAVVDEALALAKASATTAAGAQQGPAVKITSVYAHVWESNDDGLCWYRRRGFTVERKLESYYRKLRPAGAWIVRKRLDGQ